MVNQLKPERQALILHCLLEGVSVNATARIAKCSKNTVLSLLRDAGTVCAQYQDEKLRNLTCRRLEVDEAWSFVYAKERNLDSAVAAPPYAGDVWLWMAFDPDTKLVPSWRIGDRTAETAKDFMNDLKGRLVNRVQLTTDGHRPYLEAVSDAFGDEIDYAMLMKVYGTDELALNVEPIAGEPDLDWISTSGVERQNLTLRMSIRRFTRRTNGFSKLLRNHAHAIAIHYMHYNFCRIHLSIDQTPAQKAGLVNRRYDLFWMVGLIDDFRPKPRRPTRYYKGPQFSN
ncbi:MAG: IS1 family transposase [Gemmatimonadetes bacterium]|nr:IS1 family transposase [Gemmatimonadota bacterium]